MKNRVAKKEREGKSKNVIKAKISITDGGSIDD